MTGASLCGNVSCVKYSVSPAVEKLAHSHVDGELFSTCDDVLLFSLNLLDSFEEHYQQQLGVKLADAIAQLERGESTVISTTKELDAFFNDLVASRKRRQSRDA